MCSCVAFMPDEGKGIIPLSSSLSLSLSLSLSEEAAAKQTWPPEPAEPLETRERIGLAGEGEEAGPCGQEQS